MLWNDITLAKYNRKFARYPSDLTDAEWEVVAPLVPASRPGGYP
nr:hypothetical protein [Pararhizobium sp. IMCC3301]